MSGPDAFRALFCLQGLFCSTVTDREFLSLSESPANFGSKKNCPGRCLGRCSAGALAAQLGSQPHLQLQRPQSLDATTWVSDVMVT